MGRVKLGAWRRESLAVLGIDRSPFHEVHLSKGFSAAVRNPCLNLIRMSETYGKLNCSITRMFGWLLAVAIPTYKEVGVAAGSSNVGVGLY